MIQEIGTAIVMFLIGSGCTYFLGKWSGIFQTIDALKFGVQSILRDRMTQMHRYYTDKKKPIPQQELDNFEQLYKAYKQLGGNGYIDKIEHNIAEVMPHENH